MLVRREVYAMTNSGRFLLMLFLLFPSMGWAKQFVCKASSINVISFTGEVVESGESTRVYVVDLDKGFKAMGSDSFRGECSSWRGVARPIKCVVDSGDNTSWPDFEVFSLSAESQRRFQYYFMFPAFSNLYQGECDEI